MSEVRTTGQVVRLGTGNLNDFVKVACLVATQRHLGFGQSHVQSETDIAEGNYGGKLWERGSTSTNLFFHGSSWRSSVHGR